MSWLKPVTAAIAILTLTAPGPVARSDEGTPESDAPPAEVVEAPEGPEASPKDADFPEDAVEFPEDAAEFPEDAAEFPGDPELQDFPQPSRRRMDRGDVKSQLLQLLQREISRKMAEKKRRNSGQRGDLERALHQQLQQFDLPQGVDALSQFDSGEHHPGLPGGHGIHGRMEHLEAAVHHLHAAELHEMAEIVEQQANAIRQMAYAPRDRERHADPQRDQERGDRDYRDHEYRPPVPGTPDGEHHGERDQTHRVLQEMMEQMELLRREVGELQEQVKALRDE